MTDRGAIGDVRFQLYDRAVHPEVFPTICITEATFVRGGAWAALLQCGHVLSVTVGRQTLTEYVGVPPETPLPTLGRVARGTLRQTRETNFGLPGVRYYGSRTVDVVDPEIFEKLDRESLIDSAPATLRHRFSGGNRLVTSPLSYLNVNTVDGGVVIEATHTFPLENAVLRTQSLFEAVG